MKQTNDKITFSEYQADAAKTAIYPPVYVIEDKQVPVELMLNYPALGLAGEAGEFANKVKKIIRDDGGKITTDKAEELGEELGDILWYLAACATELGYGLDDLAYENREKLFDRMGRGKLQGSGDRR